VLLKLDEIEDEYNQSVVDLGKEEDE